MRGRNKLLEAKVEGRTAELAEKLEQLKFSQKLALEANLAKSVFLANIIRSGEHLLALINDVLSISKIEAGKVTLNNRDFNFRRLLRDLKSTFQSRTFAKGIDLIVELDPALPEYVGGDEG